MDNKTIIENFVEALNTDLTCPACEDGFDVEMCNFWIDERETMIWDGTKQSYKQTYRRNRVRQPNTGILDFKFISCENTACDIEWGILVVGFMDESKEMIFHFREEVEIDRKEQPLKNYTG